MNANDREIRRKHRRGHPGAGCGRGLKRPGQGTDKEGTGMARLETRTISRRTVNAQIH